MKDTMICVDLAKRVFQLHGASMTSHVKFRKKLTRQQFRRFMSKQTACLVVFEAYLSPEKFSNRTGQGFRFTSASSPGSGFSPQLVWTCCSPKNASRSAASWDTARHGTSMVAAGSAPLSVCRARRRMDGLVI